MIGRHVLVSLKQQSSFHFETVISFSLASDRRPSVNQKALFLSNFEMYKIRPVHHITMAFVNEPVCNERRIQILREFAYVCVSV